jgi:UDP-N-acetyl-2-amino-2-deoxyglucuronate dehydrogenase
LLLDLLGPVRSVRAEMDTISHHVEVEDFITARMEFESGVKAHLLSTLSSVNNEVKINISGKTKAIQWPLQIHAVKETESGFPIVDQDGIQALNEKAEEITTGREDHFAPISDMISAIQEDREPVISGVEARRVIEVVSAIYKSASTGKPVTFPIQKNDPWYTRSGLPAK